MTNDDFVAEAPYVVAGEVFDAVAPLKVIADEAKAEKGAKMIPVSDVAIARVDIDIAESRDLAWGHNVAMSKRIIGDADEGRLGAMDIIDQALQMGAPVDVFTKANRDGDVEVTKRQVTPEFSVALTTAIAIAKHVTPTGNQHKIADKQAGQAPTKYEEVIERVHQKNGGVIDRLKRTVKK